MTSKRTFITGLCAVALAGLWSVGASAQAQEVKQKPPMYTYIANWEIPRAHWPEMAKAADADKAVLDKAVADGTLVGYGNDENLVHTPGEFTHDDWWSSASIAGLMKVLDQISQAGGTSRSVLESSTKHWDLIDVSHYYNWKSGSYKNGYVQVASYTLKADAPDDAVDQLSKSFIVPLLEKQLADGTIVEYEIDVPAVHTSAPGTFAIVWVSPNADGIDKVGAAIRASREGQALSSAAFLSMVEYKTHRDELNKGNGVFK
jgi:hypothetical protein